MLHDAGGLVWAVNMGCVDLNPHPVRADDLDHPDELRVDLDPMPGVGWRQILDVAFIAREVLEDHGLVAWPKTSGSRGFHIYARIHRRWPFTPGTAGCADHRPRGRAPRPRICHCPMVERGTPRGVRRLQPERQGPDRGVGLLGARHPRCAGVDAAVLGRGRRLPARGLHHRDGAAAVRRARRPVGGDGRRRRRTGLPARPRRPTGAGREGTEGAAIGPPTAGADPSSR